MRTFLQFGVMMMMLLGAGNRLWGKVAAGQTIAERGFAGSDVFDSVVDTQPVLMSSGEAAARGFNSKGFEDGPNLYAYVKQNPWTAFDPDGLKTKNDYRRDIDNAGKWRDEKMSKISNERGSRGWYQKQARINEEYKHKVSRAEKGNNKITATARKMESVARMEAGSINDESIDDASDSFVKFDRLGAIVSLPIFNDKLGEHVNHGELGGALKETGKEILIAFATLGLGKAMKAVNTATKVNKVGDDILDWVGPKSTMEKPPGGSDLILRSADGTKQVRFDLTNPHGLKPHVNVETFKPRNLYPGDKKMIQTKNEHVFPQP